VLRHVCQAAEVPVMQLSIDETQTTAFHFELGRQLASLSSEDILVMGSGNIVAKFASGSYEAN
jgi:4,5-DOPA dioxygenase extradiol